MIRCLLTLVMGVVALGSGLPEAGAGVPERVVSINLCTDQLAMLIAKPRQLVSVSKLASDPSTSLMRKEALKLGKNFGTAEDVIRLQPDLVLAGTYTSSTTIDLLRRLGYRVEQFKPAASFSDIKDNVRRLGGVLGQTGRADEILRRFDAQLEEFNAQQPDRKRILASFEPSSYTGGVGTLENEIVKAAGLLHLGEEMGFFGAAKLSVEGLIRANPDYVMSWEQWTGGPTRATQVLRHPAIEHWFGSSRHIVVDSRRWICGTPFTLDAVESLMRKTELQIEK